MAEAKDRRSMYRAMRVVAGLVCLCASAVASPPSTTLFPTGKGSEWTYKGTAGPNPLNMTATITTSTPGGGGTTNVVMDWVMGGTSQQVETYVVSASQVARAKSGKGGSNTIT